MGVVVVVVVASASTGRLGARVARLLPLGWALCVVVAALSAEAQVGSGGFPLVLGASVFMVLIAKLPLREAKRRRRHTFVTASLPRLGQPAHAAGEVDSGLAVPRREGEGTPVEVEGHIHARRAACARGSTPCALVGGSLLLVVARAAAATAARAVAAAVAAAAAAIAAVGPSVSEVFYVAVEVERSL